MIIMMLARKEGDIGTDKEMDDGLDILNSLNAYISKSHSLADKNKACVQDMISIINEYNKNIKRFNNCHYRSY